MIPIIKEKLNKLHSLAPIGTGFKSFSLIHDSAISSAFSWEGFGGTYAFLVYLQKTSFTRALFSIHGTHLSQQGIYLLLIYQEKSIF